MPPSPKPAPDDEHDPDTITNLDPVIEKGIPIPEGRHRSRGISACIKALIAADIGDSVLIRRVSTSRVSATAWLLGGSGWVTCRKEGNNVRVWKVAEVERTHRYEAED